MKLLPSLMRFASAIEYFLKLLVALSIIFKDVLNLLIVLLTIFILVLKLLSLPISTIDVRFNSIYQLIPNLITLNIPIQ